MAFQSRLFHTVGSGAGRGGWWAYALIAPLHHDADMALEIKKTSTVGKYTFFTQDTG